ncbi:dihydrodiol dehydrogenase [Mesobacillus foraminis]|uniref:dihydrodiol dehydrogenase n=1 Tax=Mesobacillus foraminis TaxID=279826 RepID=UPI000EF48C9A|nr:dihydrodiol dehydrogenase [Mesobacillus foraminis]
MGEEEQEIRISNEFASIIVRKVRTRNGERLEIESPGLDLRIRLDALQMESIVWQKPEFFSELLANPLEARSGKR